MEIPHRSAYSVIGLYISDYNFLRGDKMKPDLDCDCGRHCELSDGDRWRCMVCGRYVTAPAVAWTLEPVEVIFSPLNTKIGVIHD